MLIEAIKSELPRPGGRFEEKSRLGRPPVGYRPDRTERAIAAQEAANFFAAPKRYTSIDGRRV